VQVIALDADVADPEVLALDDRVEREADRVIAG
jgi:hypothetical protein